MISRQSIQDAARECLGTRYGHCGRKVGVSIDCVGVVLHVASQCGVPSNYDLDTYSKIPRNNLIIKAMKLGGLIEVYRNPLPGDVGVFWVTETKRKPQPQHAVIFVSRGGVLNMVHAFSGSKKVVEVCYDEYWQRRLHTVMEFPEIEPWQL